MRAQRVATLWASSSTASARQPTSKPVALEPERARAVDRDRVEHPADLVLAGHLAGVQAHEGDVEHVGGAEGIPRVKRAVVAEADVDPRLHQLLDARQSPRRLG